MSHRRPVTALEVRFCPAFLRVADRPEIWRGEPRQFATPRKWLVRPPMGRPARFLAILRIAAPRYVHRLSARHTWPRHRCSAYRSRVGAGCQIPHAPGYQRSVRLRPSHRRRRRGKTPKGKRCATYRVLSQRPRYQASKTLKFNCRQCSGDTLSEPG